MNLRDNQFIRFLSRHAIYITAFMIPFLLMLIIFIVQGIYPFGNRSFLHVDMYHQYFPFLNEFYHKLKAGDSLLYSWNTGLGANFLALFAYYLASPFNWLCVFVPENLLIEFQSYLVVFKIGLCGFTACYYFRHHFRKKTPTFVLFSTFYALSGFMAAYNWNVMWLDCIVLAPIIILGLERLVNEGKDKLYCISLGIAILSNFYLCIMICIYLVLYFLLVLLPEAPNKFRACKQFTIASLLAGGMAAVLLLPELAALSLSEFSGSSFPTDAKSYFAVFDVLARHFMDVGVEIGLDHWPNLYCGVFVLVLLPLYVICKTIPTKQKLGKMVLLCFLLISFSTNSLSFIWHGMNYPNSLPSRQSFLYILLLLTICTETFLHIKEISKTDISNVFLGMMIFLVLCQKLVTDDAFTGRTFLLTAVFLLGYAFLLHLYRDIQKVSPAFVFAALLIVMLEAGFNTYLTSCPTVSRSHYLADYDSYGQLVKGEWEKGNLYERFERDLRVTQNDAMLFQYPSASLFSSTINGLVNAFYEEYGLKSSKVFYSYDGATPLTSALINVPYTISKSAKPDNDLQQMIAKEGNLYLYRNYYTLPFGYVIPAFDLNLDEKIVEEEASLSLSEPDEPESEPSLYELTEMFVDSAYAQEVILDEELSSTRASAHPFIRQNSLAKKLGAAKDLFLPVETENLGASATITITETGHYYAYSQNRQVTAATMTIDSYDGSEIEPVTFQKMKNRYILDLGFRTIGDTVTITAENNYNIDLCTYIFVEEEFLQLIDNLNDQPFQVTSFASTNVEGTIDVKETGYLIFSMPYEPGWTVSVDGKECEPQLFEGLFLSLPITEGTHTITLNFVPKGFYAGITVSLLSLGLFAAYCFYEKRKRIAIK